MKTRLLFQVKKSLCQPGTDLTCRGQDAKYVQRVHSAKGNLVNASSNSQNKAQTLDSGSLHCLFCGRPLEKRPSDAARISRVVNFNAPWHQICPLHAIVDSSPSSSTSDPFNATPVALNADTRAFLDYVRSFTYTINWPDELSVCREGGSLYKAHYHMYRRYFDHVAPLNGLLSYVYNLMAIVQPERATYHRQKSIEHSLQCFMNLRGLIDSPEHSDEQLMVILQTTWPLASAEYSESVRSGGDRSFQHRCALRHIVTLLGGFQRLPLIYRELIVHFFAKVAIVTNTHTEIDPADWDPGPWQRESHDPVPIQSHSIITSSTTSVHTISTLSGILEALRELVAVETMKRQGKWSDEDHLDPVFRWTYLRRIALKMRLWNLLHPSARHDESSRDHNQHSGYLSIGCSLPNSLEPCLCLAAQLFLYLSLETYPITQPWYSAPGQHAEMLARVKALDNILPLTSRDVEMATAPLNQATSGGGRHCLAEDSQAQNLLWIVAVGACFEEEMRKQQNRIQVTEVTQTATAAGFWGQGRSQALQLKDQGQDIAPTCEKQMPTTWFSDHFGRLARRLGYQVLEDATELFTRSYAYDPLIMDETLGRLFDLELG